MWVVVTDPNAPPMGVSSGDWLSHDASGFEDGPNLYAYVRQNPWTGWDPTGLATVLTEDEDLRKKEEAAPPKESEANASTITGQKTKGGEIKPTVAANDAEQHPFLENAAEQGMEAIEVSSKAEALKAREIQEALSFIPDPRNESHIDRHFPREPTAEEIIVDVAKEAAIFAAFKRMPFGKTGTAVKAGGGVIPESMTTLYHGGVLRGGAVQAGRFSTTTELEHAMRYAAEKAGGKVYQFQVPTRHLNQWMNDFKVQEFRDTLHGTSGSALELRFSPSVAPELNNFFIPPP